MTKDYACYQFMGALATKLANKDSKKKKKSIRLRYYISSFACL
jgi:hypothetical protein